MSRIITYYLLFLCNTFILVSQIKSEEIVIYNDSIELKGTLTFSQTQKPLFIWVHGSGNVDQEGSPSNYILQTREALNKKGFAFYSFDKRIANQKNLPILIKNGVNITDFADDISKTIAHFRKDNRFTKIILLGHSQGSLISFLVGNQADIIISLAGAGETIDKTISRQLNNQGKELGTLAKGYFEELQKTDSIQNVHPFLLSLFAKPNWSFLKSWVALNPTEIIKKVNKPILIINGDKDLQVPVKDAENLYQAKPSATLKIIKSMNHVLKHIDDNSRNLQSYMNADYPISESLIDEIIKFINQKHGK